ncbi:GNAT family N-acetyltransferase [Breoghania sp. L-A4]|nr:GNAT family N-acetyltransferase [Breoghania sp. L-A4]
MTRDNLETAIEWAYEEGWNPGLDDAEAFFATDPDGFLMGYLGEEPVTAISVVAYDEGFGFLGFYLCHPEHRGKGYGWATWAAGIERLGNRTIGLDGVAAQQANYEKSGFKLAHRDIRHGGISIADVPMDPRLTVIGRGIYPSIRDYDRPLFPAPRETFLKRWVQAGHATRRGMALIEDGAVTGYGVLRACRAGFKIGPLFADTDGGADVLFRGLAGTVKGQEIYLDVPEPNEAALALAERYELSPEFITARMYKPGGTSGTSGLPDLPLEKIFGITTMELG